MAPTTGTPDALRVRVARLEALDRHRSRGTRGRTGALLQGGSRSAQGQGTGSRECQPSTGTVDRSREPAMTPDEAMRRINVLLAHAWMVRTFLKHADEIQDDEEMLEVHRMIFDYCRAVEPAFA